jgi:hypothetical protein
MCRHLTLLARNDHQQMIFTCEHGTMHITHQHTTICLMYATFVQVARLLVEGDLAALNKSNFGSVREGENQQVELWLDSGGLRLMPDEFFALSDLLRTALAQLDLLRLARQKTRPHRFDSRRSWN